MGPLRTFADELSAVRFFLFFLLRLLFRAKTVCCCGLCRAHCFMSNDSFDNIPFLPLTCTNIRTRISFPVCFASDPCSRKCALHTTTEIAESSSQSYSEALSGAAHTRPVIKKPCLTFCKDTTLKANNRVLLTPQFLTGEMCLCDCFCCLCGFPLRLCCSLQTLYLYDESKVCRALFHFKGLLC